MNRAIEICLVVCLTGTLCASCKGDSKEKYAAAVAGTAASLAVIQAARAKNPKNAPGSGPCCDVCDECSFPCGDHCVPIGTPCVEPKGCACYPGGATVRDVPPEQVPAPNCMQQKGDPVQPVFPVPLAD